MKLGKILSFEAKVKISLEKSNNVKGQKNITNLSSKT